MKTFSFERGWLVLIFFLVACSSQSENSGENEPIELGGFNFSILNAPDDASKVEGKLSRSGYNDIPFSILLSNGSGEITLNGIEEGAWTLSADALNSIGQKTYRGTSNVVVVANEVLNATLILEPLPKQTTGRISVTITWGLKFTEYLSVVPGSNSASLSWKTNINSIASVHYKTPADSTYIVESINDLAKSHQYTISSLNDTTEYSVFIIGKRNHLSLSSDTITVKTIVAPQSVHLTFGNPTNATSDILNKENYLMIKDGYVLSYHEAKANPNWVSWHLDQSWRGSASRQNDYRADNSLPTGWNRATGGTFGNGYDRGHIVPSADRTKDVPTN